MDQLQEILARDAQAKALQLKKGSLLLRAGERADDAYFVKSGLLRSYIIDSKGKEHIFMFAPEGWVIADVDSMEFDHPSELFIDCIEDSEVVAFNKDSLLLGATDKETIRKNAKLLFRRMGILQRRIIMQMSAPAMDRYHYFTKTYPDLLHRIPQHMIASYMGITPQALSSLRSKIARQ